MITRDTANSGNIHTAKRQNLMTANIKNTLVSDRELEGYLANANSNQRLALLEKWLKSGLSMDDRVVNGLLKMGLPDKEMIAAFQICSTQSKADFELWVMDNVLAWDQNIAAMALRAWARITDRVLWHRLLPITLIGGRPQRILYTILDIGITSHGHEITRTILNSPGWEDLSAAFHALLLERSLQYDLKSERLTKVAKSILDDCKHAAHPENKALIPATAWLCSHAEKDLQKWLSDAPQTLWRDAAKQILDAHSGRSSDLSKLEKLISKGERTISFSAKLPPLWSRRDASSLVCLGLINTPCDDRSLLTGFSSETLSQATEQSLGHKSWAAAIIGQLPLRHGQRFSQDPNEALAASPDTMATNAIFARSYDAKIFPVLAEGRALACEGKLGVASDKVKSPGEFSVKGQPASVRATHSAQAYFDVLSGSHSTTTAGGGGVWSELARAVEHPGKMNIDAITATARKHKGLVTLAYIGLLSRLVGRDDAVLKLLDHIRGDDEAELCAVTRALGQINTPRSLLELIAMLTRPNATVLVQQEIVTILAGKDLSRLQTELASAIQDLPTPPDVNHPLFQIKEELSNLLTAMNSTAVNHKSGSQVTSLASPTGAEGSLDTELRDMIPHYSELSSEVKRALRTALFFNRTVTDSPHAKSIDLSPLIDMQYKAMELLYREFFEGAVSQSLNNGAIQRKLDVIGYARPIERQMDDFESYIAMLPVVKSIPFFSKFKMRKTLRAICMFQPGRRFTLDGLKAFGLYFLVFGRQECKHGLADTFRVGASNDLELAEFCKELHIFQDFRNRAAHEGFHPDASNDILGIWRTTASVVAWAFKIRDAQASTSSAPRKQAS
jgi:hypothetical protein